MPLGELKATLIELEHLPSGAQVMHIENDDPENLFCLSFETLPVQFQWRRSHFRTYGSLRIKKIPCQRSIFCNDPPEFKHLHERPDRL